MKRKVLRRLVEVEEQHLSEFRIVLLGSRMSGKSSAGNTILGREEFESGIRTAQCVKRQGEVAGRQVTVVDTPGWCRNVSVKYTPELDKQEILRSVSLCPPGPCALLVVLNVSLSFTETHRRSVQEHLQLLSERVWRHTIVLFTWGDWLGDTTIEQRIETEGKALQWLVEKCGNRYHVLNNENRGDGTQITVLLERIEEMVGRNKGDYFRPKENDEGFDQLLKGETLDIKQLKRMFEEELTRREEEMIERMSKVVVDPETDQTSLPLRKRRCSMEHAPPSMSGETPAPSEAASSVRKKVSTWLKGIKPEASASSGYGTGSSEAMISDRSSEVSEGEMSDRTLQEEDSDD
ncbi:hypothetical protein AGOR_G00224030 [Albula goreensis]|uniref:AIG1-type G domain-containing protein n=1 Tax=Albula goreensis TaxID=1534307 RepID=A0A8T3CN74_9TELE|nr:hypothetical protein AGOR_G00224030 [Albula goreensis]